MALRADSRTGWQVSAMAARRPAFRFAILSVKAYVTRRRCIWAYCPRARLTTLIRIGTLRKRVRTLATSTLRAKRGTEFRAGSWMEIENRTEVETRSRFLRYPIPCRESGNALVTSSSCECPWVAVSNRSLMARLLVCPSNTL
ncbi:hypothetical protein EVAR_79736_1 [Eumeta japonica]|uniref:Uncharacterized protein n=1 Tax=Eumeta variegata TaxID=151549 RepID=A0A4C1TA92_EUMVA|nr:hypothetical protein EVAR_79736_1 [Eumeta japonica]